MADRIQYPPASYPGICGMADSAGSATTVRLREIEELQRDVPDCVSLDAQRRTWQLQVLLPYANTAVSGQTVILELEVPLDYPTTNAVLRVSPAIPHLWVHPETGVLQHGDNTANRTLKQIVLDGYEALSGARYFPQRTPGPSHDPGLGPSISRPAAAVGKQALRTRIEARFNALDEEELFKLLTDQEAFMHELLSWIKETDAGKKYLQAHQDVLQAAQSNKDLIAEYEGTEQQVRVTQSGEVDPSMFEHDDLLARQAAVVSKVDLDSLVASMTTAATRMDTGEADRAEILSRGAGDELSQAALSAKIDAYKQKRQAYHEADIKAKAASQLMMK